MKERKTIAIKSAPSARQKNLLFKLIAVMIPFLFLILLEGSLRLFGYGHDLSLFITDPADENVWVMNSHASEKFFSNTADATVGNAEKFSKEKPAGAFRIFVLGESTTIGYPYMHNGSFHRMLQYRLLQEYPAMNTEIINLSLTAVNSYTVLDFAKKVVNYSPDAVLIYCGHNEYYGAMGAASTNSISGGPFFSRALPALRTLRTWQLLNNCYAGIRNAFSKSDIKEETLMKRMAGKQQVVYGSPVFEKGVAQFRHNMEQVCALFSQKNIPVFISNLVSNEKNLEPFISSNDASSAINYFNQAQQFYNRGAYTEAKQYFDKARQYDLLRFRAPEQMNEVISSTCKKYTHVYLVDAKAMFEKNSTGGITGDETLLEHVHPNLFGYAVLSDAFYHSLKEKKVLKGQGNEMSFDAFRASLPVTKVDSIKGAYEIAVLKMRWPFHDTARQLPVQSFEEQMASRLLTKQITWNNMLDTLLPYYLQQRNYAEALKVAESAMLEYPADANFYIAAASCSRKLLNNSKSEIYLQKAFGLRPSYELAKELVDLHLSGDDPAGSMRYLDYIIANNKATGNMQAVKQMLTQVVQLKLELSKGYTKESAQQVAAVYSKLGYDTVALRYMNMKPAINGSNY